MSWCYTCNVKTIVTSLCIIFKELLRVGKRIHSEYSVYDYMALVIVVSFLGFCLENIWMFFSSGVIDNRNMHFPFLIGYGFAVLFIYMVLGVPQKNNLGPFFIACFFIVSVGEILLGYAVEKFCGIYYWDYTDLPMHLTRYTSFFTSIGFSTVITVFFYRFFTPLMNYFKLHENNKVHVVCVALLAVLVMDLFFSFGYMHSNRATNLSWVLHFPAKGSGLDLEIIPKV